MKQTILSHEFADSFDGATSVGDDMPDEEPAAPQQAISIKQ